MILVTGAAGSVGQALLEWLEGPVVVTDLVPSAGVEQLDVTDALDVREMFRAVRPSLVYHLAAAKHAPDGELDPAQVADVNITGTLNILAAVRRFGGRVIMSSTCKACDPETAYGASKLIAERAVLNAGGTVIRFHNIPESSGNVFRLWESLPAGEPIPVTRCRRYFTPLRQAVGLLLEANTMPPGRYACKPQGPLWMEDVASSLYPGRDQITIPRRRGDRLEEPLIAGCETVSDHDGYLRISGAHDPVPELAPLEVAA